MRRLLAPALFSTLSLAACGDNQTRLPRDRQAYIGPEPAALACVPDLDGKIEARELRAALGVPVQYLVSSPGEERAVDLEGSVGPGGLRVWNWSADYAGDRAARIEASAVEGKWYAGSFAAGQFVAPFDASGDVESVYAQDDAGLYLLGLASREPEGPGGKTLLIYEQPVLLYRFPLEAGASWVSVGKAKNSTLRGLPYAGKDVYEIEVAAEGELRLPDVTFTRALQVRQRVTVEPAAGPAVSTRQVSFLFECFGEVARATSRRDEPEATFVTAAETRRFGLE